LSFWQHVKFYSNKILSMVKYMKMLGNPTQSFFSYQKCLLYRTYILSIILYSFSLWYYNNVPLSYPLKKLRKMQYRAVLWILSAFHIFPTLDIKVITGLIPIYLHFQKLDKRQQLRIAILFRIYNPQTMTKNQEFYYRCQ